MKKYSVIFFIKQSLKGLFMNGVMSITSIFILTACLILTGCFALLSVNANINLQQLDSLNKIVFYVAKDHDSTEEIDRIQKEILALPNVKDINFISKDEALSQVKGWEQFAEILGDEELFDNIARDNLINDSIEIEFIDISDVHTLVYQLKCIEGVEKVKNLIDVAEFIKNLKNVVMLVLAGFAGVLFVIAIFIILNTVKLSVHARKNEIEIMRYIGATNFFIVFPFLLEGVIIGLVSGIFSFVAQYYIYGGAKSAIENMSGGIKFIEFSDISMIVFFAFIITGALCGLLGSGVSSRRYLKV